MATTYFVANAGSDTANNGLSSSAPFATIGKAQTVAIQGDTVSLNRGDRFTGVVAFTVGVTINAYGTGTMPVWQPAPHTLDYPQGDILTFTNCGGITLDSIEFIGSTGTYAGSFARMIMFLFTDGKFYSDATINNCIVHDGISGIAFVSTFGGAPGLYFDRISVTNCHGYNLATRDFFAVAYPAVLALPFWSNVTVDNNLVTDVVGINTTSCYGMTFEGVTGLQVSNNTVKRIGAGFTTVGGSVVSPPFGIEMLSAFNGEVFGNYVDSVYTNASDAASGDNGGGIVMDSNTRDVKVYNNYITRCDGPGVGVFTANHGNSITNNIITECCQLNPSAGACIVFERATDCLVVGNTIFNTSACPAILFSTSGNTAKILNNALLNPTGVSAISADGTGIVPDGDYYQSGPGGFQCNNGATNYTSLAAWQAAMGGDASSVAGGHAYFAQPSPAPAATSGIPTGPAGVQVYAPLAGSPLLNAGANLLGTYGITPRPDFLGNPWTQNSIGAIYVPGVTSSWQAAMNALDPTIWFQLGEAAGMAFCHDTVPGIPVGAMNGTLGAAGIVPGDPGTSATFSGTQHVLIPTIAPTPTALTVGAWINPASVTGTQFVIKGNQSTFLHLVLIGTEIIGNLNDNNGNRIQVETVGANIAIGQTYLIGYSHAAGTNTLAIYVNGVAQTLGAYSFQGVTGAIPLGSWSIGAATDGTSGFNGSIKDVFMIESALTGAQWAALYAAGSVASYVLTGPTKGSVGVASSAFTLTPTSAVTDTASVTSSAPGDTVATSPLSFSASATPDTFTVTGSTSASRNIAITSTSGLVVNGSPAALNIAVPFTVTGPAVLRAGVAATITVTPSASTTATFALHADIGGTFSPTSLSFTSGTAQTVQYTPPATAVGAVQIGGSVSPGALVTPLNATVYNVDIDVVVNKAGKTTAFVCGTTFLGGNNQHLAALIFDVNAVPVFECNGSVVQTGPVVPTLPPFSTLGAPSYQQYAHVLNQYGGVESIAMTNAGNSSYTAPTVTETGGSPVTPATYGTPVLARGLLAYTITSAGSGLTGSFEATVPAISGQSPTVAATVWVTVSGGIATSVIAVTGSALSYGVGFTGTSATGIVLSGGGGSVTVSATIGNYIQSIPVLTPGVGYKSPPSYTIADSTGSGAHAVPTMTGPLATDVITVSYPSNLFSTLYQPQSALLNDQTFAVIGLHPGVTNGAVTNSVGHLEPNGLWTKGFTDTPTLLAGVNMGFDQTGASNTNIFWAKNKLRAATPWQLGFGTTATNFVVDSHQYPVMWDPGGLIFASFYGGNGPAAAFYQGNWNLQYDDDFYGGLGGIPAYCTLSAGGNFAPVANGPHTGSLPTATCTISGGAVNSIAITSGTGLQGLLLTIAATGTHNAYAVVPVVSGVPGTPVILQGGAGFGSAPTVTCTPISVVGGVVTIEYAISLVSPAAGSTFGISLQQVAGADGLQHAHNPCAFAPNNTIDRSKPYAIDDNIVAALSNNGNTVGVIRAMSETTTAGFTNLQDLNDRLDPNAFSWQAPYWFDGIPIAGAPHSPTFSGTCSLGSTTVTGIADTSFLEAGDTIYGNGIPGATVTGNASFGTVTTIVSLTSSTITLSTPPKIAGIQTLSVNPTPTGRGVWSFARAWNTNSASTTFKLIDGVTNYSSPNIYSSCNWANSGTDGFGSFKDITHGPNGVNDNGALIGSLTPNQQNGISLSCGRSVRMGSRRASRSVSEQAYRRSLARRSAAAQPLCYRRAAASSSASA